MRPCVALIPSTRDPGFAALLDRIEGNGVRTIIVETATRFARDPMVQEGWPRQVARTVMGGVARGSTAQSGFDTHSLRELNALCHPSVQIFLANS